MCKKTVALLIALCFSVTAFCSCGNNHVTSHTMNDSELCTTAKAEILEKYKDAFDEKSASLVSADFLDWIQSSFGNDSIINLHSALADGTFTAETWHEITGSTAAVLECFYTGMLDPESPNYRSNIRVIGNDDGETVIRITGDLSLADNWLIMPQYDSRGKGLEGVLSPETIGLLQSADITLINNEFCYSRRGTPLKNKMYTFRADTSRVSILNELGIDIVSLANNHAYDYGADAFTDTMQTLSEANIAYIGGGSNLDEAFKPFYFITGGRKIAFAAATKAEKYRLTPQATEDSSGVLLTYDPELYTKVIENAAAESDYCIAYVHWGLEGSHEIEEGLREMGAAFIDAGADIVVGAHAHLLQGIEFYNGKPIVFNLGNFLFNAKTMDSGILELSAGNDGIFNYRFIPCIQSGCYTETVSGDESRRILDFLASMSDGVAFDNNGYFREDNN